MLWWTLATFVIREWKSMLRKNWLSILAEREVPQHRNCQCIWCDEFMITVIMMDMGCAVYDVNYIIKTLWMSEHAFHCKHSWIVEVLLALPGVVW